MKAISLWQPWATLIAIGAKTIETRGWLTHYRGPLAIHAAKKWGGELNDLCSKEPFREALQAAEIFMETWRGKGKRETAGRWVFPLGSVVAICRLVGCIEIPATVKAYRQCGDGEWVDGHPIILGPPPMPGCHRGLILPPAEPERSLGLYDAGRFAWILTDVVKLPRPVPWKGKQGWMNVPDDLLSDEQTHSAAAGGSK